MKNSTIFVSLIFFLITLSCKNIRLPQSALRKECFSKCFIPISSELQKKTYCFYLPKGYTTDKISGTWDYERTVYKYKDSLWFYIVNSSIDGPGINYNNKIAKGLDQVRHRLKEDSIYMEGRQKNGQYWKEYLLGNVAIGYINVPAKEKEKFDKAIESLTLVKTGKCK